MTRQETVAILRILRTLWPTTEMTNDMVTAWTWALEDHPYPLVEDAAKRYMRTGKFFPKPAELLELIGVEHVAPNLVPEAAWAEVQAEVRRVGYNRLPTFRNGQFEDPPTLSFSNPLIAEAVESIGWSEICTSDQPGIVRAQFVKALQALLTRSVQQTQTGNMRKRLPTSTSPELDTGVSS